MTISKIQRAQDEIAQILKRLEVDTGQSVSSIEIRKIEILRIEIQLSWIYLVNYKRNVSVGLLIKFCHWHIRH